MAQERVEVPIAGKIISVYIEIGGEVKEGDTLCLLESMKMENPILAPVEGVIVKVEVVAEQVVEAGDLIAIIAY